MDFSITESRCKVCQLPFRSVIDNLLTKDNVPFDRVYAYLVALCQQYNCKIPSRQSLKRHGERHLHKEIDLSEIIAPDEHIIDENITYDALMDSISILNEKEFKTLYEEWMLSFKEPVICMCENFYRRIQAIFNKSLPTKSSQLLQHFREYVQQKCPDIQFQWEK